MPVTHQTSIPSSTPRILSTEAVLWLLSVSEYHVQCVLSLKSAVSHDSACVMSDIYVYNLLEFVLYIADDLTVEKVDDALCASSVLL